MSLFYRLSGSPFVLIVALITTSMLGMYSASARSSGMLFTDLETETQYIRQYMAREHFFDRISVAPSTSGLTVKEQVDYYRQQTRQQLKDICQEYPMNEAITYGKPTAAAALIAALFIRASKHFNQADEVTLFTSALALGWGAGYYGLICLKDLAIQGYYFLHPPQLHEADLIIQYGSKKNLLPGSMQAYIENELFYAYWQHPSSEGYQRLRKMLDKVLRLPLVKTEQQYSKETAEAALKNFPEPVAERLDRFARSAIMKQKMPSRPDKRYVIYFQGRPGTGKTFASHKLAEVLGAKCIRVNLEGASIKDIIGTPFEDSDGRAGRLLDAIVSSTTSSNDINDKNQILLIDEFDRLLTADDTRSKEVLIFMLNLLDPTTTHFSSPYLKADIDLPETIILAGNTDMKRLAEKKPELEALISRIRILQFPGFDSKAKIRIARDSIVPKLEKAYSSAGGSMSGFKLSSDDLKKIDDFIYENNRDKGLRSLEKFIDQLFEMKLVDRR
ncbi:AAA family ATPase [Endozoicomonas lisbonensis]|uniref:AAA+ ATPase domain-containing protein n=1 Tax=Endozoicomonas lisbonensis TaxID=3120522 RepID=A0ABV2SPK2_9GAMM